MTQSVIPCQVKNYAAHHHLQNLAPARPQAFPAAHVENMSPFKIGDKNAMVSLSLFRGRGAI